MKLHIVMYVIILPNPDVLELSAFLPYLLLLNTAVVLLQRGLIILYQLFVETNDGRLIQFMGIRQHRTTLQTLTCCVFDDLAIISKALC